MPYKDPEVKRAKERERYYRNRDAVLQRMRERWANDPEHREKRRKYKQRPDVMEKHSARERQRRLDNPMPGREHARRQRHETPEIAAAHQAVKRAKMRGDLVPADKCERCDKPHSRMNAHHEDYSKQLEVEWLCPSCHNRHHAN